jgi:Fe-S oxidoreductase
MLIEEFVQYAIEEDGATLELDGSRLPDKLMLHGHCHQKALVGTAPAMSVLKAIQGCDVEEIPSGCCGMAGSFGFEEEHFDISMKIGEQTLFPAIRNQSGDFAVVAEGVSCRQQIQDGTGKRAMHLVEVLAEAL